MTPTLSTEANEPTELELDIRALLAEYESNLDSMQITAEGLAERGAEARYFGIQISRRAPHTTNDPLKPVSSTSFLNNPFTVAGLDFKFRGKFDGNLIEPDDYGNLIFDAKPYCDAGTKTDRIHVILSLDHESDIDPTPWLAQSVTHSQEIHTGPQNAQSWVRLTETHDLSPVAKPVRFFDLSKEEDGTITRFTVGVAYDYTNKAYRISNVLYSKASKALRYEYEHGEKAPQNDFEGLMEELEAKFVPR